jgi:ATP-dependent DNA ligase
MVPRPLPDEGSPVGFVAVDLLRVDGQELFGVPLLERKRLLDGILRENALVRITPFTRPPVAPWLTSWRASGFAGVVLKAANSRYQPSSLCHDWVVITKAEGR